MVKGLIFTLVGQVRRLVHKTSKYYLDVRLSLFVKVDFIVIKINAAADYW